MFKRSAASKLKYNMNSIEEKENDRNILIANEREKVRQIERERESVC